MHTVKLGELPVGALFVSHGEWSDGSTVFVKLADHGFSPNDKTSCHVGNTLTGRTGPLMADVEVQELRVGPELAAVAFGLASTLGDYRQLVVPTAVPQ